MFDQEASGRVRQAKVNQEKQIINHSNMLDYSFIFINNIIP